MSRRILLGTRKGMFSFVRSNGEWRSEGHWFIGTQVPMLLADPRDGVWYAAVGHGHFGTKFHRSEDQGKTWKELTPPTYPEKPADAPEVLCPMRKTPIPWSLELLWSLEPGGRDQPGRLWAGTIPGGLFRSEDRGDSWQLIDSLWNRPERSKWFGGGYDFPGVHSICVDPRDSRRVGLGISCGGYWVTQDDGVTWTNQANGMRAGYMPPDAASDPDIQDPHRIVQCQGQPSHLWCQHHSGVFRSTDDGRSWSEINPIQPSNFGFAVAVHPQRGDVAWFAPAQKDEVRVPVDGKVVVTRTRDGGQSFEVLDRGLPGYNAFDLIYRHGLVVDETGDSLAMGSTTGSLWVSENGGDTWNVTSHHLPPVFCVRWA